MFVRSRIIVMLTIIIAVTHQIEAAHAEVAGFMVYTRILREDFEDGQSKEASADC